MRKPPGCTEACMSIFTIACLLPAPLSSPPGTWSTHLLLYKHQTFSTCNHNQDLNIKILSFILRVASHPLNHIQWQFLFCSSAWRREQRRESPQTRDRVPVGKTQRALWTRLGSLDCRTVGTPASHTAAPLEAPVSPVLSHETPGTRRNKTNPPQRYKEERPPRGARDEWARRTWLWSVREAGELLA